MNERKVRKRQRREKNGEDKHYSCIAPHRAVIAAGDDILQACDGIRHRHPRRYLLQPAWDQLKRERACGARQLEDQNDDCDESSRIAHRCDEELNQHHKGYACQNREQKEQWNALHFQI